MESPERRERVGPGGDPVIQPGPTTELPVGTGVVLDCGWGRLVFGQTFADPLHAAEVLRAETPGSRDICIYLEDPHVLVSRHPDELFIDPSLTYRLQLPLGPTVADESAAARPEVEIRLLRERAEAEAVNGIYARNGMVTAPVDVLTANAATDAFVHLVAALPTGELVGSVTGVDHVAVFAEVGSDFDAEAGSSLWCLTVDPNLAPPGTGAALLVELAARLASRGRAFVDLSVLADNAGAIRLYERLGFRRTPTLCLKRKNPINEKLFVARQPEGYDGLNPYARVIADEALRRGVRVEVLDAQVGELRLTHAGRAIVTLESLSELTTAVALFRCDDKRITRRILAEAGLRVPRGRTATGDDSADDDGADDGADAAFLAEVGTVVVKPARGEQGQGITVGVRSPEELRTACRLARTVAEQVLIEELVPGEDLRVVVIDHAVVAAAVRRPATVTGDGTRTVAELIARQSRRREAATDGESRIPLDDVTRGVVEAAGVTMDAVLPRGRSLAVRRTANLHTGGTIHDVTANLHPAIAEACVRASQALGIPVTGLDLMVVAPDQPEHAFIEANERPGLANHEPQPVVERFVDLLFPGTSSPPRRWLPGGPPDEG